MDELDYILIEQYHTVKRRLKIVRRYRVLLKNDPGLDRVEQQIYRTMQFLEDNISDKTAITKKIGKRKKTEKYCANSPWFEYYKSFYAFTLWYSRIARGYTRIYIDNIIRPWFKKSKCEESGDGT